MRISIRDANLEACGESAIQCCLQAIVAGVSVILAQRNVLVSQVGAQKDVGKRKPSGGILALWEEANSVWKRIQVYILKQVPGDVTDIGNIYNRLEANVSLNAKAVVVHAGDLEVPLESPGVTGEKHRAGLQERIHAAIENLWVQLGGSVENGPPAGAPIGWHSLLGDAKSSPDGCLAVSKNIVGKSETRHHLHSLAIVIVSCITGVVALQCSGIWLSNTRHESSNEHGGEQLTADRVLGNSSSSRIQRWTEQRRLLARVVA